MIPVLNSVGVHCAVYGNHDFGGYESCTELCFKLTCMACYDTKVNTCIKEQVINRLYTIYLFYNLRFSTPKVD